MLPSPLPPWLRDKIAHVVASYTMTAQLCERRCRDIEENKRRGPDGRLGDRCGSIQQYRMDAKYCAGMATRLPMLLDDRLTAAEKADIIKELISLEYDRSVFSKEIPRDPRLLAGWAWRNPWEDAVALPPPEEGIKAVRADDRMQELGLTQREAEAWILVRGYDFTAEEAATIMEITANAVEQAVKRARRRMKMHDDLEKAP